MEPTLSLKPIGIIRTEMLVKFDAPHQPDVTSNHESIIELFPKNNFEQALQDLSGFDRIWLIWWFHKNENWRPMVLPPRGSGKRRGVFATRSPHRPNPIGITAVPLLKIEKLKVYVGSNDLIDGTPILDIKPYLSSADAFPHAKNGWVAEVDAKLSEAPEFQITFSKTAKKQLDWLKEREVEFLARAIEILERDPSPHRTRRITKSADNLFRIGCGAWRMFFSLNNKKVNVEAISPGFPLRILKSKGYEDVPHRDVQLSFLKIWPES